MIAFAILNAFAAFEPSVANPKAKAVNFKTVSDLNFSPVSVISPVSSSLFLVIAAIASALDSSKPSTSPLYFLACAIKASYLS